MAVGAVEEKGGGGGGACSDWLLIRMPNEFPLRQSLVFCQAGEPYGTQSGLSTLEKAVWRPTTIHARKPLQSQMSSITTIGGDPIGSLIQRKYGILVVEEQWRFEIENKVGWKEFRVPARDWRMNMDGEEL
ncbi:hypothetical protein N7493_009297 [Penicillium malachiteum]|uniref:Uncharacterized protein n=1 Tax=Penicillium malachiteum TaxID=1324776 RepID=A0AAD6HG92_9EURO|nr:hypothetical protein N7493_009297 [Penicillium malachiteum]